MQAAFLVQLLEQVAQLLCSSGYVETQFMEPDFDHRKWRVELQVCGNSAIICLQW